MMGSIDRIAQCITHASFDEAVKSVVKCGEVSFHGKS